MTMKNVGMNFIDRTISIFSPRTAARHLRERQALAMIDNYSFVGASKQKSSLKRWGVRSSINPDEEVIPERDLLTIRARDLYKNNAIAAGAIKTNLTNVVGPGLSLHSRIDRDFLGLSDDQADAKEREIERLWSLWANYSDADAGRRLNFNEIQQLAYLSFLNCGEVLAMLPLVPRKGTISDLRVQLIEADLLSNPWWGADTWICAGGIEVGDYGEPIKYHIQKTPKYLDVQPEWVEVPVFGKTGRPNIIHLFKPDRPGQRRGIPYLTPVIELIKQIGRYSENEIMAAVVSSMYTVFVKSTDGNDNILGDALPADDVNGGGPVNSGEYEMGNGAIVGLLPGESIDIANPQRPNSQFEPFLMACLKQIGMALQIPYELLVKQFNSSFSASRAAFLEAWKGFKVLRGWFAQKFDQIIFEEWLTDMVVSGIISLPGFMTDLSIRRAWCVAEWIGPTQGQINPTDETEAAAARIELGITTKSEETAQITGQDWERNIRQRAKEERLVKQLGLVSPAPVSKKQITNDEESGDDLTAGNQNQEGKNAEKQDVKNSGK